ncbi:MAG: 50S ribosomal protein L9 [Micavibrio sp. TMED27]|nr:50S ribosomal protein L9 [Micavibrio sp.]OUT92448.1 MAG: 50S ribosomal protein L9 [Micavibrio sp. TMED27]|tara:strand:- start:1436 stop:2191 length:756 start_codon:yes stop_codon:yes gene_type:complete
MATQVILLERVEKLGNMGEVVNVKPGYARNFLLPQKKALRASKENIAYFDSQKKVLEAENEKRKGEAAKLAKKLEGVKLSIIRAASESGHLYGSVASRDIASEAKTVSGVEVSRSMVDLNQNFKEIGLFPVSIALHPEVKVEVIVNIARTVEEAKIQSETGKALVAAAAEEVVEETPADAEEALAEALEDSALEAEKERQAEEAEKEAEEAVKAEERAAKKAEKEAAKAAAEEAIAENEAAEESAEEAKAE